MQWLTVFRTLSAHQWLPMPVKWPFLLWPSPPYTQLSHRRARPMASHLLVSLSFFLSQPFLTPSGHFKCGITPSLLCFKALAVLSSSRISSLLQNKVAILTWRSRFLTLLCLQWSVASSFMLCLLCSLSPSGAMWPGIKTETGLSEAPSGGQPGFLSFSSTYTSAQPAHLHYSYPSQGKLQLHSISWNNAVTFSKMTSCTALFSSFVVFVASKTVGGHTLIFFRHYLSWILFCL